METVKNVPLARTLLIASALVGIVVMGYLVNLHYRGGEQSFCNLGEGLSCDVVNKSIYSEVFGIPVSILGLLYFIGVAAAALFRYRAQTIKLITLLTIVFLGPSLYLSYLEYFVINNVCVLCELSKLLMVAILVTGFIALPREHCIGRNSIIASIVFGVALAGVTLWAQSRTVPPGTYTAFAQCLDEKGFKMYGSVTCASCAKQRLLFGDAFEYIEEIECDPRNPDPQVVLCVSKNIEKTPTWMQEDAGGNELYRFDPGIVPLQTLADVSGCTL